MVRRPLKHRCHQPDHGRYPAGARRCQIIDDLRKRERNRLIELPRLKLRPGDRVRLLRGPFAGHLAIFAGMKPRERVVLTFLGAQQRVTLPQDDVERIRLHDY